LLLANPRPCLRLTGPPCGKPAVPGARTNIPTSANPFGGQR